MGSHAQHQPTFTRRNAGNGLLGALAHFGLDGVGVGEKEEMRRLVLSGALWSAQERAAIIEYCEKRRNGARTTVAQHAPRLTGFGPCCGVATWQRPEGSSPTACRSM
jgi:hypothetical protein